MPQYRVPFSGAILVETDEPPAADIYAGCWSASVLQLTLGFSPQKIMNVKAIYFDFDSQHIEDISKDLQLAQKRLFANHDPIALQVGRAVDPYYNETQECFHFYEQDCRDT